MSIRFRRLAALLCLLLCFSLGALADTDGRLTPTAEDLTEAQLREYAADFFSRKCGLKKEKLLEAEMEIFLWQPGGYDNWSPEAKDPDAPGNTFMRHHREFPQWTVHVQSFPGENGQHQGFHLLALARSGELIFWSAHGPEFWEENPDLLHSGTPQEPLPADAKKEDVISQAQKDVKEMYGVQDPQALRWEAGFIGAFAQEWDSHIPVWIVNAYQGDEWLWKGMYGYNGVFISLVPAWQDYESYEMPGEHFFPAVFGDAWWEESMKMLKIDANEASVQQAYEWLKEIKPIFENWAKDHPYAAEYSLVKALLDRYPID